MKLSIRHTTRYTFEEPVSYGLQQLRKTPKSNRNQTVLSWSTQVQGGHKELAFEDYHNNVVELLSFDKDAEELSITSQGEVEIIQDDGVVGRHFGVAPLWLFERATKLTHAGSGVRGLLQNVDTKAPMLDCLHQLMQHIGEALPYETGSSESGWTAEEVIKHGKGVCQDHTHVFLACARAIGCPVRYVSGYLMLNESTQQDAMHAWAEAHVNGLGWVGFDVSNCISPDQRYVRVATGLDYSDAAPVIGTRIGGENEALTVSIEVAQQ